MNRVTHLTGTNTEELRPGRRPPYLLARSVHHRKLHRLSD